MLAAMIATSKMMCLTRPSTQPPQYAPESRDVINPAACRDRQGLPASAETCDGVAQFHQPAEKPFVLVNRFDCASCRRHFTEGEEMKHDFGVSRCSHCSQHRHSFGPCLGHVPIELMSLGDYRTLTRGFHFFIARSGPGGLAR
jgi:hypothetical protein